MIISVTERGVFKRCRQMWEYSSFNRQSLTSQRPPAALSFGTLIHKIHEEWILDPDSDIEMITAKGIKNALEVVKEEYRSRVGVEPHDEELETFFTSAAMAHDMFLNYKELYGASLPEGYELIAPEQTIVMPIPGTEHLCETCSGLSAQEGVPCVECNGTGTAMHYLEGTLDLLMQDSAGRLWVLDHKTYNSKPRIDHIQMNDQFIAYLWLLKQMDIGSVGGMMYDGMWKRFKEKRKLEDLFFRTTVIHSDEEIANFEIQLRDEVLDMVNPSIYRNARWEGCWDCQFVDLCQAEFRGEDAEYVRARYVHREKTTAWQSNSEDSQ